MNDQLESEYEKTAEGNEVAGHNLNLDAYQLEQSYKNTEDSHPLSSNPENALKIDQFNELSPVVGISEELSQDNSPLVAPTKLLQQQQDDINFQIFSTQ